MSEKYLKVPPDWILRTIKRELNVSGGDTSEDRQDRHEMALAYWRQNRRQYPPVRSRPHTAESARIRASTPDNIDLFRLVATDHKNR
jgi:hypothetical protein